MMGGPDYWDGCIGIFSLANGICAIFEATVYTTKNCYAESYIRIHIIAFNDERKILSRFWGAAVKSRGEI